MKQILATKLPWIAKYISHHIIHEIVPYYGERLVRNIEIALFVYSAIIGINGSISNKYI